MRHVPFIDATGILATEEMIHDLAPRCCSASADRTSNYKLDRSGILESSAATNVAASLERALAITKAQRR